MKTKDEELVYISLKLAYFLRYLRKKNNWTQERLAEISTVDYKHIQRLESVKYISDFRFSTLRKLSKAFNIDILDFLECIIPNGREYVPGEVDVQWGIVAEPLKNYEQ